MSPTPDQVREQLARILESAAFRTSEQRRRLLSFLVEGVLAGKQDELKEYALAVEALGRPLSFDPRLDSIVRVQATHVRTRLRDYYNSAGRDDVIIIDLPTGGYVPTFRYNSGGNRAPEVTSGTSESGSPPGFSSIAVLPCLNLDSDSNQQYFCDGVTEEIINELAQWPDLHVIARTSVFCVNTQFLETKEIGKILGAEIVLQSSARRVGQRIRITARLANTSTGITFWSRNFDKHLSDMIAFQEEIAETIVGALRIKITERVHRHGSNESWELYNDYLFARYHFAKRTDSGLMQAIRSFEGIIAREPSYALAYAGLADCLTEVGIWGLEPVQGAMERAWAAGQEALRLNEYLAEAHVAIGTVSALYHWDGAAAKTSFARAISLAPSNPSARYLYGLSLMVAGSFDEGLEHLRLAVRLDPLSLIANNLFAMGLYYAGLYEEALQQSLTTLNRCPEFGRARAVLAAILLQKGSYSEAAEAIHQDAESLADHGSALTRNRALRIILEASQDNQEVASALLKDFLGKEPRNTSGFWLAMAYAALADRENAFFWLQKALETRDPWVVSLWVEPLARPLREDSRFRLLVDSTIPSNPRSSMAK